MEAQVELFPLPEQEQPQVQELFPSDTGITVPKNLGEIATQAGLVDQSHSGKELPQAVRDQTNEITSLGIDSVRSTIANKEQFAEITAAENSLRTAPTQDTMDYYQSVLDKHNGVTNKHSMEEAVVEIITPPTSKNYYSGSGKRDAAKDLAARNIIYEAASAAHESASVWDKVLSFGRDLIPFVGARATTKAVAEAMNKEAKFGDYFNTSSIMNEFKDSFIAASPEKRKEMAQALVHGIEKYSSFFGDKNDAQVVENLNKIIEHTDSDALINTMFDVAGLPLVGTAKVLVRGARFAAELGKPAVVASRIGNSELAATLMARDAAHGTSISGMSTDEIARKAMSMNITPMELQFDELKLSQSLQDKIRQYAGGIRDSVDNTLMPTSPSTAQVTQGYNYYNELYNSVRNKAIYEYTPTGFKDGEFFGEIKWQNPEGTPFGSYAAATQFGRDTNKVGYATLAEPSMRNELASVFRSNRTTKKYLTPNMPESEYLGRQVLHDEKGPYVEVGKTPSWGYTPEVKENWIFVESMQKPLPTEAIGKYAFDDVEGRNFVNAKIPMFSGSIEDVSNRGLGRSAQAKINRDLENAYKEASKGLPLQQLGMVYTALKDGDSLSNAAGSMGHVFTSTELEARGLSEAAQEAYYKHRVIRDSMWLIRGKEMRRELNAQGMMEMAFDGNASVGPLNRPAKPIPKEQIRTQIANGHIGKVLDTHDGKVFNIHGDDIDGIYDNGGQVVRLYKPELIDGRRYTHLVVHQDDVVFRDIHMPLPYRSGEFARVYQDEYMIRMNHPTLDEFDMPSVHGQTVRTAPSKVEAEAFVSRTNKAVEVAHSSFPRTAKLIELERLIGKYYNPEKFLADAEAGLIPKEAKFDYHYTRDTHTYMADTIDESITNGRLFYSPKGEKLLSTDPARENTLGIVDSLAIEMANVSRYITSKDVRIDAIERWMNTFGDGLVNRTHNNISDFTEGALNAGKIKESLLAAGDKLSTLEADQLLKFAEDSRQYIKDSLNLKDQAQKVAEVRHRRIAEFIEKDISKLFGKAIGESLGYKMRQMSLPDFMRNLNFNITLGMFNPAQLIVQANGMFLAVGAHPLHGLPSAKTAIALRMALMSDKPEVWRAMGALDSASSLGLRNINEFVDSVKAIRKSGILADIKSTALYNIEDGALNLYKNEIMNTAKDVFNKVSPAPFNLGEEMSRLTSWEIARRVWRDRNPGKLWTSDEALREISIRQKEWNIGMQSYNTAPWQKGWAGIPLQFLQYNIKLLTALGHTAGQAKKAFNEGGFQGLIDGNYRGFNPREAAMVAATQVLLTGASGTGLVWLANKMAGDKDTQMSEEQKMYVMEGLFGGIVYSLTKEMDGEPAKLALGKRLGSLDWYNQIYDKIVNDKTDITDFLFGVTKSSGVKIIDIVKDFARLFYYGDPVTPELFMDQLSKMPEIVSSWSNATKAHYYMMHEGFVTSKDGTPIARLNTKENLAAYLGLSSVQVQDYYDTVKTKGQFYDNLKEIAKTVQKLQVREWDASAAGDRKLADDLHRMKNNIMAHLPSDQQKFIDNEIKTKIWPGDTASEKIRREFVDRMDQEVKRFSVMDKGTQNGN